MSCCRKCHHPGAYVRTRYFDTENADVWECVNVACESHNLIWHTQAPKTASEREWISTMKNTQQNASAPALAHTPAIAALLSGDIALRDTTSTQEAASIRVIDALPRKIQTVDFLTGGYCVAKCYGPNREAFARLFVASPDLLAASERALIVVTREVREGRCPSGVENSLRAAIAKAKGRP